MKCIRVEITINRYFVVEDADEQAVRTDGIIPDLVNQKAPKSVPGWTIEGLTITDQEGIVIP